MPKTQCSQKCGFSHPKVTSYCPVPAPVSTCGESPCVQCPELTAGEIKVKYESNYNTNAYTDADRAAVNAFKAIEDFFTYLPAENLIQANKIIKNKLTLKLGDQHDMSSAGDDIFFLNNSTQVNRHPLWGGIKDQTVPANQDQSGLIPPGARVYAPDLTSVEPFGPVDGAGAIPFANFDTLTDNTSLFGVTFVTADAVMSTDVLSYRVYNGTGTSGILVFDQVFTGTAYAAGATIVFNFDSPLEAVAGATRYQTVVRGTSFDSPTVVLNVRPSSTMATRYYVSRRIRTFTDVPIEDVTAYLYSTAMDFSADISGTTIILTDPISGNTLASYPINILNAIDNGLGGIQVMIDGGIKVFIRSLDPLNTSIDGISVSPVIPTAVNELNALFHGIGGAAPIITSATSLDLVTGTSLNYELVASGGVAYEWTGLPTGIAPAAGNIRNLIGGTLLVAGVYNFVGRAINFFGEDAQTFTLTVTNPGIYINSLSTIFQNFDYCSTTGTIAAPFYRLSDAAATPWTYQTWFKGGTDFNQQTLFSFGEAGTGPSIQIFWTGNTGLTRSIGIRYGNSTDFLRMLSPIGSVPQGSWHNIIVIYDGGLTYNGGGGAAIGYSRFSVYIDGVLQVLAGTNGNDGFADGIDPDFFLMARITDQANYLFGCNLDETAFWGSDQTANVAVIYNGGVPHDLAALGLGAPLNYYRMGDGDTYPTITDVIGTQDFTMLNMTAGNFVNDVPP